MVVSFAVMCVVVLFLFKTFGCVAFYHLASSPFFVSFGFDSGVVLL